MNIQSTTNALLIAPWASLVMVAYDFGDHILKMNSAALSEMFSQMLGFILVLLVFTIGHVGMSYIIVFVAGLPAHWLLSKLNIRHWFSYVAVGFVIAEVWKFTQLIDSDMPVHLKEFGYLSYGVCSAFVSLLFWYVAVYSCSNSNADKRAS